MIKLLTDFYNSLIKSGFSTWVANQNLGAICYTNYSGQAYTARMTADKLAEAKEASEQGNDDKLCKLVGEIDRNDVQEAEFRSVLEDAKKVFKAVTGSDWRPPSKTSNASRDATAAHAFLKKRAKS